MPPSIHCLTPPDLRPADIRVKLAANLAKSPIIPSRVDPLRPSGPRKYNGNQGRYVKFVCLFEWALSGKPNCTLLSIWTKKVHKYKGTKADW